MLKGVFIFANRIRNHIRRCDLERFTIERSLEKLFRLCHTITNTAFPGHRRDSRLATLASTWASTGLNFTTLSLAILRI